MPVVVERLPPMEDLVLPQRNINKTFSKTFLRRFCASRPGAGAGRVRPNAVHPRPYRILRLEEGPLLPREHGKHGARIHCDAPQVSVPLLFDIFVGSRQKGYRYLGTYRNPQRPELIGCNEMINVPSQVKRHLSEQVGEMTNKSKQTVGALTSHWPRVKVGWLQPDSDTLVTYESGDLGSGQLVSRRITYEEAPKITTKEVHEAFETVRWSLWSACSCWPILDRRQWQILHESFLWIFRMCGIRWSLIWGACYVTKTHEEGEGNQPKTEEAGQKGKKSRAVHSVAHRWSQEVHR